MSICANNMSFDGEFTREFNQTLTADTLSWRPYEGSWISYVPFAYPQLVIVNYEPWIMSVVGSFLVGLSGILPLFILPVDDTATLRNGAGAKTLRVLLSFAVGGLLGDVFLHLLPEAWGNEYRRCIALKNYHTLFCGPWVLTGMLVFIIIEKMFGFEKESGKQPTAQNVANDNEIMRSSTLPIRRKKSSFILNDLTANCVTGAGVLRKSDTTAGIEAAAATDNNNTGDAELVRSAAKAAGDAKVAPPANKACKSEPPKADDTIVAPLVKKVANIHISGYLNLMANSIDNFTHGLAVGGSFILSTRVGMFTTFAILVHEIPHEVGDFAILLKAGFTRWDAACAQLYTACAGIVGALTALVFSASANAVEARTSWILPFTAGGFLHIALVTVLPELLAEKNPKESLKQMCSLAGGITIMALLTALVEG